LAYEIEPKRAESAELAHEEKRKRVKIQSETMEDTEKSGR